MCSINSTHWLIFLVVLILANYFLKKKYWEIPKDDMYTNNPKGENVIKEEIFFSLFTLFPLPVPKLVKQMILC